MSQQFVFVPRLPTKAAYANKPFSDYSSLESLYAALKSKDVGDALKGYINFREGFYSEYKDGSEPTTYEERDWHQLGYTSCARGCCFSPPCPDLISWKESDGREELSRLCKEHVQATEENYARHLDAPNPMPRFERKVILHKRSWQEFKRVSGPGGLKEQMEGIKDKSTIKSIWLSNFGWFKIR